MLRRPQILTRSCPLRSLLLLFRESHVSAVPEHAAAAAEWRGQRREKERRPDGNSESGRSQNGSSVSTETAGCLILSSSNLDCHPNAGSSPNTLSKAFWESHRHHPQVPAAAKTKQAFYLVGSRLNCYINTTCVQCQERTWDFSQTSFSKSHHIFPQQTSQYLHHMPNCFRPFHVSTRTTQISNFHTRPRCLSISYHPSRAAHQTAPRISNTWRDCLSPENEARCRQSLGPNLKLYQLEKERKGANPSQGSNQARWASVLVSLCSVESEPSILFTLRSSMLKGRHKGDVSFAGGKSDPSDGDVVTTALREAREELGVTVRAEQVWGVLKPLRDASGMMIAPVLANLGPLEELTFKPNPGEVEEIFTLSLSHLCDPQNRGYTHFRTGSKYGYTLPVFRNGKHRVWGLTAVALEHTLKLIVSR